MAGTTTPITTMLHGLTRDQQALRLTLAHLYAHRHQGQLPDMAKLRELENNARVITEAVISNRDTYADAVQSLDDDFCIHTGLIG